MEQEFSFAVERTIEGVTYRVEAKGLKTMDEADALLHEALKDLIELLEKKTAKPARPHAID